MGGDEKPRLHLFYFLKRGEIAFYIIEEGYLVFLDRFFAYQRIGQKNNVIRCAQADHIKGMAGQVDHLQLLWEALATQR